MLVPDNWERARLTLAIAAATAAAWAIAALLGWSNPAALWGGFIPERFDGLGADLALAPLALTPLTATFVHAGLIHVALNLLMLLFCGRPVENIIGPIGFGILYVVGAYAAAAVHYLLHIDEVTPMVGASGAVSAVIGAYAILFGRNRVRIADPTLALWINALWLAAAWIGLQLIVGLTFETTGDRIAIGAHIGGFLAGLALAKPLLVLRYRRA